MGVFSVLRRQKLNSDMNHDLTHTHSRRSPPHLIIFVEFMLTLVPFVAALQPNGCPSWKSLATELPSVAADSPVKIDSVRQQQAPVFSNERPTLFRERHGWCPYSERVWLALETKGIEYDTVLIDNTGGGRPSYFSGSTPQMRWADGRMQGESLDLVKALDKLYPEATPLWPPEGVDTGAVNAMISAFKGTFPRSARPSSRAAFLFSWDGDALPRATFETVLSRTDELLAEHADGPFFCGAAVSAADVAWAPFLERYAAQLPCLHDNLLPRGPDFPHLAQWFDAMETAVPSYACRVEGDASSWRKVLSMAGYGNAGVPAKVLSRMDEAAAIEAFGTAPIASEVWERYAASRPYVATTPAEEVAATLVRNRDDVAVDAAKRAALGTDSTDADIDAAMRSLAWVLMASASEELSEAVEVLHETDRLSAVASLALFLDDRLCCPRDMGSPAAAELKRIAGELKRKLEE